MTSAASANAMPRSTQSEPQTQGLSLLADIGGTNTRVALARNGALLDGSIKRYRNAEYAALEPVLNRYLTETGCEAPQAACLAMAGPVREGVGRMTNLDWTLDADTLASATGAETVALLNDLQAQGQALGHLREDAVLPIVTGLPPRPFAAQLVVGVGTGFNAAPVYNTATGRYVPPSECGHISLPIHTETDLRLAEFVEEAHGFAAVEDVLSGRGLERLYKWHQQLAGVDIDDKQGAQIVADHAAGDPVARATLADFARLLGNAIGDLALTHLPFGGIYLIGGVARAVAPHLVAAGFIDALRNKGRFSGFMAQFAVSVVADDDAALTGSALHLQSLLRRDSAQF